MCDKDDLGKSEELHTVELTLASYNYELIV